MPIRFERAPLDLKIEWPTISLSRGEIEVIKVGRTKDPLRTLVAQTFVSKATNLWRSYQVMYPQIPYNRSDEDVAINLGYAQVGEMILANKRTTSEQATAVLQKDPTGLALLQTRLVELRRKYGNIDPEVMGFEIGVDHFGSLYNQAVKSGVRSDRQGWIDSLKERIELSVLRFVSGARRVVSGVTS